MNRYMILAAVFLLTTLAAGVYSQVMRQQGAVPSAAISLIASDGSVYQITVVEVNDEQGTPQPVLQLN